MRIAIFSDIHANLNGLNAVLTDIDQRGGADLVVAAGDLVTDGPRPVETFNRLVEAGCLLIRGNHDEYLLGRGKELIGVEKRENIWLQTLWTRRQFSPAQLDYLEQQPLLRTFRPGPGIKGHDLMVVHANLRSPFGYTGHMGQEEHVLEELYGDASDEVEVIAFGHWHSHSVRLWRGMRLVNVASVAYPMDRAKLAGYTFFTWDENARCWLIEQHRVSFNWREEARLIRDCGMPGQLWQISRYYQPEEELVALEVAS